MRRIRLRCFEGGRRVVVGWWGVGCWGVGVWDEMLVGELIDGRGEGNMGLIAGYGWLSSNRSFDILVYALPESSCLLRRSVYEPKPHDARKSSLASSPEAGDAVERLAESEVRELEERAGTFMV